jgi:hypothetical protein
MSGVLLNSLNLFVALSLRTKSMVLFGRLVLARLWLASICTLRLRRRLLELIL